MRLLASSLFITALLLVSLQTPTLAACIDPPYDLISWWTGDGTPEDVLSNNDGTLMGGMGFSSGKVSQSFEFDGTDDYVDAGNGPTARPDFPFSVAFWINRDTPSLFYAIASTATVGNGQYSGFRVYVSDAGTVITGIGNDQGCCGSAFRRNFFSPAGVIGVGTWHHVAVVFQSATSHLVYVDGAAQSTTSSGGATTMVYAASNLLQLGRTFDANSSTFTYADGKLDDVQLVGAVLDPAKIQEIYQAGSEGQCTDSPVGIVPASWGTVKAEFAGGIDP